MLKFSQFLKEANISGSGSQSERHFAKYVEPWLPGNARHGETIHELGTTHKVGNDTIPAGTRVAITGHAGQIKGVHHVNVETEHGTTATIPVSKLKKPPVGRVGKNPEEVEDYQIKTVHEGITKHLQSTGQKETTVHLPDGTTVNVAGARKVVPEDYKGLGYKPKADMILYDKEGKPVHYASLKGHTQQQYGGVTHLSQHPVVKKAVELFKRHVENRSTDSKGRIPPMHYQLDPADPVEKSIIHQSMFGKDHGKGYGLSNVHAVYQGDMHVKPNNDKSLSLSISSSKFYSNKNNNKDSDVAPNVTILAKHASDRNDLGIKNTRINVSPLSARPNAVGVRD